MKYDVKTIFFKDEQRAKDVLEGMNDMLNTYGIVTVSDYYDIVGSGSCFDDRQYGWVNLDGVIIKSNGANSYYIDLPRPLFICDLEDGNEPDMVNHPPHYQSETGLEVIDVIEAFTMDLKGIEATDTGNVIKYICRWKGKNGLQDLEKAKWYLEHLIAHVKKLEE